MNVITYRDLQIQHIFGQNRGLKYRQLDTYDVAQHSTFLRMRQYTTTFVIYLAILICLLLSVDSLIQKPNQANKIASATYSHRCRSKYEDTNVTLACTQQLKKFWGIEIDVMYDAALATFVLAHVIKKSAQNQGTYTELEAFVSHSFAGSVWFDLKFNDADCSAHTGKPTCTELFLDILQAGRVDLQKVVIEVGHANMLHAFQNASFKTISPQQSLWGYDYVLFRRMVPGMVLGDLHDSCFTPSCSAIQIINWIPCLSDAFFLDGGRYVYSDAAKPPTACARYVRMDVLRIVIYATGLLLLCLIILVTMYIYSKARRF